MTPAASLCNDVHGVVSHPSRTSVKKDRCPAHARQQGTRHSLGLDIAIEGTVTEHYRNGYRLLAIPPAPVSLEILTSTLTGLR